MKHRIALALAGAALLLGSIVSPALARTPAHRVVGTCVVSPAGGVWCSTYRPSVPHL